MYLLDNKDTCVRMFFLSCWFGFFLRLCDQCLLTPEFWYCSFVFNHHSHWFQLLHCFHFSAFGIQLQYSWILNFLHTQLKAACWVVSVSFPNTINKYSVTPLFPATIAVSVTTFVIIAAATVMIWISVPDPALKM